SADTWMPYFPSLPGKSIQVRARRASARRALAWAGFLEPGCQRWPGRLAAGDAHLRDQERERPRDHLVVADPRRAGVDRLAVLVGVHGHIRCHRVVRPGVDDQAGDGG